MKKTDLELAAAIHAAKEYAKKRLTDLDISSAIHPFSPHDFKEFWEQELARAYSSGFLEASVTSTGSEKD